MLFIINIFFNIRSHFFKNFFDENISKKNNYSEFALLGIIISSLLAFFINFFISLNRFVNDFLFLLPFLILLLNSNLRDSLNYRKILKLSIIAALISTIVISYDNVYRPDAGSYHLPFISIINDNKIIIGLSNLHFRFGHISIIQYLSGSFNNHLFLNNGILIPGVLIFSFMCLYLLNNILDEESNFIILVSFIFLIFICFRMNRYSSFGNDAPAHFYYMYIVLISLNYRKYIQNYNNFFNKISLVAIFVFFNKITMLLSLIIPLFFIKNKNFKII